MPILSFLNSFFFDELGMLAPRPTLLFLDLGPARNQQLGPRMSCIIFTAISFKNSNYICNNCVMIVAKILGKFEVYFNGFLKFTFALTELC
jgi:hypothetical protein